MNNLRESASLRYTLIPVIAVICLAGGITLWVFLKPNLPPAERGRRLAESTGCFNCHGPGGIRGIPNPGRLDGRVPTFEGDLMMYAEGPDEIREWIRDGVPEKRARSKSWQKERDRGVLVMPAFGDRLSDEEIDDLVAYVMAVHGSRHPTDSLARAGSELAEELGCFGCHGPGGHLAPPNPGSLKGYIPSWDGEDFPDLVRDRTEFRQWVEGGISDRFAKNPLAQFFLDRATLHMPAFRDKLEPGDVSALWAYVSWLQGEAGAGRGAPDDAVSPHH